MSQPRSEIAELARRLDDAECGASEIERITIAQAAFSTDQAYLVQEELIALKEARGHRVIGWKMGLTSRAKQLMMGIDQPIYGSLLDYMRVDPGGTIQLGSLIHPKVEPEIAFVLARELRGSGLTVADVLAATDHVVPALEVLDSRYVDFKFAVPDVIADNTSACRFVIAEAGCSPESADPRLTGVVLERNGSVELTGAGGAVLGHPARSVAMLAALLDRKGKALPAGALVLTGGITEAIAVAEGDLVSAHFDRLGSVSVRFGR